ncbi:hypothetical protein CISIN_1g0172991mg, partial [Citrus sinensis]|jgi:hypothetical protein
MEAN